MADDLAAAADALDRGDLDVRRLPSATRSSGATFYGLEDTLSVQTTAEVSGFS